MDIVLNFSEKLRKDPLAKWTLLDIHYNEVMSGIPMEESLPIYIADCNDIYVVITAADASLWQVEHLEGDGQYTVDPKPIF